MENETGEAPRHPIGVVSERTGLTPDVIRVWERRYGVVEPARDAAGNRLYTGEDVARLELLARGVEGGRSIGRIAGLAHDALAALVREDAAARFRARGVSPGAAGIGAPGASPSVIVERAMARVRGLDGEGLEKVLDRGLAVLGVRPFLEGVAAPLFRQIGDEWHGGTLGVAAEHMASGVMVALLGRLRRRLPALPDAPLLAVATPAGERHEVGALLAAAVAAAAGWRVLYLGADLPATEIAAAAAAARARAVAVSVVAGSGPDAVAREIGALTRAAAPGTQVLVGGAGAGDLGDRLAGTGAVVLSDLDGLAEYLSKG